MTQSTPSNLTRTAPLNPDEITLPYVLKLKAPFEWGQESVTEVAVRHEPTAGDLANAMNEKKQGDQALRLVSAVTGWEEPKVKAMGGRDFLAVSAVVTAFLPAGPGTGN